MAKSRVAIIIVAAGSGSRMREQGQGVRVRECELGQARGACVEGRVEEIASVQNRATAEPHDELPKQFIPLCGRPIVVHTILRFIEALPNADIVVVLPSAYLNHWDELAIEFELTSRCRVCVGGDSRFESVRRALEMDGVAESDFIGVHDGVRPLLSVELIRSLLDSAESWGSGVPVVEPVDSFRSITERNKEGEIVGSRTVERSELRAVQTPQFFRTKTLINAYRSVGIDTLSFTDDASLVEYCGGEIRLCEGERENIKITTPIDVAVAKAVLSRGI